MAMAFLLRRTYHDDRASFLPKGKECSLASISLGCEPIPATPKVKDPKGEDIRRLLPAKDARSIRASSNMVHDRSVAIGRELPAPIEGRDLEPVINLAFCGTPAAVDAIERSAPIVSPTNSRTRANASPARRARVMHRHWTRRCSTE
jgi:hypothetical protein